MFLSGMQNKKILQWDTRTGEIVQVNNFLFAYFPIICSVKPYIFKL